MFTWSRENIRARGVSEYENLNDNNLKEGKHKINHKGIFWSDVSSKIRSVAYADCDNLIKEML